MMGMGGTGLTGVGGWGLLSFRALEEVQSRLALISLTILSADVFVHPSGRKGKIVFISLCYLCEINGNLVSKNEEES